MQSVHKARAEGASITAQVAGRPVGIIQGIAGSFNPFAIRPSYIPLEGLSSKERIEQMRDPALRAQLLSEEPSERQLARLSQARQNMVGRWDKMFATTSACRSSASRTCSRLPARAAHRCFATCRSRSNSTRIGSLTV